MQGKDLQSNAEAIPCMLGSVSLRKKHLATISRQPSWTYPGSFCAIHCAPWAGIVGPWQCGILTN